MCVCVCVCVSDVKMPVWQSICSRCLIIWTILITARLSSLFLCWNREHRGCELVSALINRCHIHPIYHLARQYLASHHNNSIKHTHTYIHVYTFKHSHTDTHRHTHTHTHTYIHTHIHKLTKMNISCQPQ